MKKIIFKNFLRETTEFFLLSTCAVTIIVWVIQAVNYLEFVTEDGHSFKVYFLYTIYSLPKIFNRLLPFMFFFSIFFNLIRYEEQNQTLIFWTNGIKKLTFLNILIKYSFFFIIINFFFTLFIVPFSQDKARSYIRNSNIDYLPLLIKPRQFIDTVEELTIYTEDKNDDILKNIIIKDSINQSASKIIYAKRGFFTSNNDENFLVLTQGKILNISSGKINSFDFDKTQINLSKYTSKTTKDPKLQEVNTLDLYNCLFRTEKTISTKEDLKIKLKFKCYDTYSYQNKISQEFFSRIFKPLYLPLLALISGLLLIKSKNSQSYSNYKFKIFILGVMVISISEISTKFYSISFDKSSIIFITPFLLFFLIYQYFLKQFNLKIHDN
tara:strand:+ start:1688 stop:2833 length:1146 start_codon:yes stop_codon:yes gene_type:complete